MARRHHPSQSHLPPDRTLLPVLALRDAVHFPGLLNTVHVVRERSLEAVKAALQGDKQILVLSQRDMSRLDPQEGDLHTVGVLSEVLQAASFPDGSMRLILRGLKRAKAGPLQECCGYFRAPLTELKTTQPEDVTLPLVSEAREAFAQLVTQSGSIPPEAADGLMGIEQGGALADHVAHYLAITPAEKQQILEEIDAAVRLERVYLLLRRERHVLHYREEIRSRADAQIAESQREFVLREQLRAIQCELYGDDGFRISKPYWNRLRELSLPSHARAAVEEQIGRLERLSEDSPEAAVISKHIECLLNLPWTTRSDQDLDLSRARAMLDAAHLGMDEVKVRILEFLAVMKLTRAARSTILCFEGPPGVGKTSLAKSIAGILNRSLFCVSLGGLRDQAELRGHRRTYVGSQPGRIIQGLIGAGSRNPVCLLDEIDKVTFEGARSDVASALLEILDPTLNFRFRDHFLDVDFDLSEVLFIATANSIDALPPALKDRLEVIPFSSYSDLERTAIAKGHLFPRALTEHGLGPTKLAIDDEVFSLLVRHYAREAGVRQLERLIANICRKSALAIASGSRRKVTVTAKGLSKLLGSRPTGAARLDVVPSGTATGLVVASYGGDAIQIEAAFLDPLSTTPEIRLTGNMGNVMQESAETAVSFLRSGKLPWVPAQGFAKDIHIHASQADRAKEGPSAGLAIAIAIASAMTDKPVASELAVTGEISLLGKVLPVGGIREKMLAAHRLGYKRVILPEGNVAELEDLPTDVKAGMVFQAVSTAGEALDAAFSAC